jgi:hypothetical protein
MIAIDYGPKFALGQRAVPPALFEPALTHSLTGRFALPVCRA